MLQCNHITKSLLHAPSIVLMAVRKQNSVFAGLFTSLWLWLWLWLTLSINDKFSFQQPSSMRFVLSIYKYLPFIMPNDTQSRASILAGDMHAAATTIPVQIECCCVYYITRMNGGGSYLTAMPHNGSGSDSRYE